MTGNEFGKIFKLTSFGESHGVAIGGVIQGFPANFSIDLEKINIALTRRKPGFSISSTSRNEQDTVEFLSGIFNGKTIGTPIAFIVRNQDAKSSDYDTLKNVYRPSHADYSWDKKFGIRDHRGGGRSSARETLARVVAGELARQFLLQHNIRFETYTSSIADISILAVSESYSEDQIYSDQFRCPNAETSAKMHALIEQAKLDNDSLGGTVVGKIYGLPAGLGEPVFDKFHAELAKAMLSINAVKAFEIGEGFEISAMKGSQANDEFYIENGEVKTRTNHGGGVLGGITNGMTLQYKVAFKPVASISSMQNSVDIFGNEIELEIKGRHDVCVVPRAVSVVESMAAMLVLDMILRQQLNQI